MSSTHKARRTLRAAISASTLVLTLLATSACGPDNSASDAATTGPAKNGINLGLPANLADLKKWSFEDWEKWANDYALPAVTKGYWTLENILEAKPADPVVPPSPQPTNTQAPAPQPTATQNQPTQAPAPQPTNTQAPAPQPTKTQAPAPQPTATQNQPTQAPAPQPTNTQAPAPQPTQAPGDNGNDPVPNTINAQPVPHPYAKNMAVNGKFLYSDPGDPKPKPGESYKHSCSGTVVADPAHPGKSNLVWTAAHCVHQGKGGTTYGNITFFPGFNTSGAFSNGKNADVSQVAPYGVWDAVNYVTSPIWKVEGDPHLGTKASQADYAIVRVKPENDTGKSLEEAVGGSVPVWFNAPRDQLMVTAHGYPSNPPFDGREMEECAGGKPVRQTIDPAQPPMLIIGCTMTGGSSGGGWTVVKDGKPTLVSNVSLVYWPDAPKKTSSGPYLDDVAANLYNFISKKG
ncbi:hypothetical protein F7Q99_27710 [Streptomyces kaniharaensis]|uniref:Trypsin-like serine protease n=1 Tax=Streptomyces kaniharaensis TaxID=212423 RepID=A0A6N7KZF9_9ACTN|nr:hypothetical protein [Streptomyces kaniharaensis]MQS15939.1 hypothetical protein [Streptomyces kaniharaensis]